MGLFVSDETSLEDLVAAAQKDPSNDSPAIVAILGRFERLALRIGRRVARAEHYRDDVTNGARWGVVLAVRAHKIGIEGFPSFAKISMYREAVRWAKDAELSKPVVALDDLSDSELQTFVAPVAQDDVIDLDAALGVLRTDQRELTLQRYVHGVPLAEIAASLGVSVSAVSQRLGTIHKKLAAHLLDNHDGTVAA